MLDCLKICLNIANKIGKCQAGTGKGTHDINAFCAICVATGGQCFRRNIRSPGECFCPKSGTNSNCIFLVRLWWTKCND